MQTKLTLRLDEEVIRQAKESAKGMGKSLSEMVEDFFKIVTSVRRQRRKGEATRLVKELRGCIRGSKVTEEDYYKYLEEKYR